MILAADSSVAIIASFCFLTGITALDAKYLKKNLKDRDQITITSDTLEPGVDENEWDALK
jgi:hypothetical protein